MRVIAILLLLATNAVADELPSRLLLKCEGKVSFMITGAGSAPTMKEGNFDTTLSLENGQLDDTDSIWMSTKNCELRNNIIHCSAQSIETTEGVKGSEHRKLDVYLTRETGEYNLFLETSSFDGPHATGKQTTHMQLRRNGVCRDVGKPIF